MKTENIISKTIYKLIDPINKKVRYVGLTSCSLKERLSGHLLDRKSNKKKWEWIQGLKKKNKKPIIKPIVTLEFSLNDYNYDGLIFENHYIKKYQKTVFNMPNHRNKRQ